MSETGQSVRDLLYKEHRIFERLADGLDRARLRQPSQMRELCAATLDVLVSALDAHEGLEQAVLDGGPAVRAAAWEKARRTAELQHDGISSLIKDMRIIVSDPASYRSAHLASLAYLLSKSLRDHIRHEESELFPGLPALERPAPTAARDSLRRVEAMLGNV